LTASTSKRDTYKGSTIMAGNKKSKATTSTSEASTSTSKATTSTSEAKDKPQAPKVTKYVAKVSSINAKEHYLANGGTKQVLACACFNACKGNVSQASVLFDMAGGLVRKATCKGNIAGSTEHTKYVTWAGKEAQQTRLQAHKAYESALALAVSVK